MIENLTFTGQISEDLLSDIRNNSMEGLLWNLIDSIPINISIWESGRILYANPVFYKCLDIPNGDSTELNRLIESDDYFIVHPDDFNHSPESTNALKNELSSGIVFHKELRMKSRLNKEYRWYNTYIVKGTDQESKVIIEIDEDIHEKKTATELLKDVLKEKNDLLNEKDLLLTEVHHRVENNFQVISSLLKLQSVRRGD